jgi:hypothetical protein
MKQVIAEIHGEKVLLIKFAVYLVSVVIKDINPTRRNNPVAKIDRKCEISIIIINV